MTTTRESRLPARISNISNPWAGTPVPIAALPSVIPSAAEGSAVLRTYPGKEGSNHNATAALAAEPEKAGLLC
jgi:hypothetical protein